MSFFDFIKNLFTMDKESPEFALKRIKKVVLAESNKFYNPKKDIVYKSMGKEIYNLYQACLTFATPLGQLFSSKKMKTRAIKIFLATQLDKNTMAFIDLLDTEKIDLLYKKYGYQKLKAYYNKIFKVLDENVTIDKLDHVDGILEDMQSLLDLCEFNFVNLLTTFDPKINTSLATNQKPKFQDNKVDTKFIENLSDLLFLIHNFSFKQEMQIYLLNYLKKYDRAHNIDFNKTIYHKKLRKIFSIISEKLTDLKLTNYMRLLYKNPDFLPKTVENELNSASKIFNDYIQKSKKYLKTIENKEKSSNVTTYIKKLFPKTEIISSQSYNESISQVFMSVGLPQLGYSKAYSITKTFIIAGYEGKYKSIISTIVFKAVISDDDFNTTFNNTFHDLNELIDHINEFEEKTKGLEKIYNQVLKKPDTFSKSKSITRNSKEQIAEANKHAIKLVFESYEIFKTLNECLNNIVKEKKSNSNKIIKNLTSNFDENFIKQVERISKKCELLCYILKYTANIKE